jgi:hypothetical protein
MNDPEIAKNASDFRRDLPTSLASNIAEILKKNSAKIDESYARLTCLQAIRIHLLNGTASDGAIGFFYEAQGDGLTSQVLALSGSSRSALKSLRSLIENIVRSVYYADHAIEYRLWEDGKHRPTFKSFFDYLESHPDIRNSSPSLNPCSSLHANWKKLSQAVHASAKEERMTSTAEKITIWKTNQKSVGDWSSFQKNIMKDVCLLYIILFHKKMQGAALKPVKESLSISIPKTLDAKIFSEFSVRLPRS